MSEDDMDEQTVRAAKARAETYKTEKEHNAFLRGFQRGYNFASGQELPEIGVTVRTDSDGPITIEAGNQWDVLHSLVFQAEMNDRDFSPFEFTAHEFNTATDDQGEDISEELWEAFDNGIADGIFWNTRERQVTP